MNLFQSDTGKRQRITTLNALPNGVVNYLTEDAIWVGVPTGIATGAIAFGVVEIEGYEPVTVPIRTQPQFLVFINEPPMRWEYYEPSNSLLLKARTTSTVTGIWPNPEKYPVTVDYGQTTLSTLEEAQAYYIRNYFNNMFNAIR